MKRESCPCPDRHEPKITCGYPMPCPHHTSECARKLKVLVDFSGKKKDPKKKARAARPWRRVRVRLDFTVSVTRPELVEISDPDFHGAVIAATPYMVPGVKSITIEPGGKFSVEMVNPVSRRRRRA